MTALEDLRLLPADVVRCGNYVFVAPTVGADAAGRLVGEADDGGYTQARIAFRRIELGLQSVGAELADVVQTRMLLSPNGRRSLAARGEVLRDVKPSALGFRLESLAHAGADVEIAAVAVVDERRTLLEDESDFGRAAAYARAFRVGGHVLIGGTVAADSAGALLAPDPAGQAHALLGRFAVQLAELGASLADVVQTRIYLHSFDDLDAVAAVHAERLGDVRPATSVAEVFRFGGDETRVKLELEAIVGGAQRVDAGPDAWEATGCAGAVRAGEQILVAGRTAAGAGSAAAQCERILERIEADLAALGASLGDVVQQHVYVAGREHLGELREALRAALGERVATAFLLVRDVGRAGAAVQIDARAMIGRAAS